MENVVVFNALKILTKKYLDQENLSINNNDFLSVITHIFVADDSHLFFKDYIC